MKQSDNKSFNGVAIASGTVLDKPVKLTMLLIPFAILFILGACLMGVAETMPVFIWTLVLMLIGLTIYPIATYLFTISGSGGFFLSQPLGLITAGFIVWTFTYIGLMRFNLLCIFISLVIIAGISYGYKPIRSAFFKKINTQGVFERIVIEESIFAFVLVILCYFKGFGPMINGQEKFMDYGFIMSMLRNPTLPANDMWLSGKSINYYYFGQYLYAFLIKASGVTPGVGYNVAMCSAIAIPFTMAYSIGCMLVDSSRNYGLRCGRGQAMTQFAGVLSGFTVMIFGNSHSFFYDQKSLGHGLLALFDALGFRVGNYAGNDANYSFFYPDSTRYVGYNPDSAAYANNGGDYTIEEFPFYSYLVGDLHAHVVSTMVVLLIMAVCIALVSKFVVPEAASLLSRRGVTNLTGEESIIRTEYRKLISAELIAIALLLGCAQMTNYWDFLIYFIFSSMTLFVVNTRSSAAFSTPVGVVGFGFVVALILGGYLKLGSIPFVHVIFQIIVIAIAYVIAVLEPCALTRTSFGMSFIFAISTLAALPFNANFDMISNALGIVKNQTPAYQLYILWCTHAFVCITFMVFTILYKNYQYRPGPGAGSNKKRKNNGDTSVISAGEYANPIAQFFGERNIIDVFVCGMTVVGFLLIIAPEIFYVRDIYTGGYLRANTMFKFCYAAFIILSVAMAYAIIRLFWLVNKKGEYSNIAYTFAVIFCLLLIVPGHYTYESLDQRAGLSNGVGHFITLDGTAYLDTYDSSYIDNAGADMLAYEHVIDWFNENVSGDPVILESYGDSYTDYCMVSAYTGLPTVRGWLTHEWLWRYHGIVDKENDLLIDDPEHSVWDIINPRSEAVDTVYRTNPENHIESEARAIIQDIIDTYNIEYIVIGDLEIGKYGDNTEYLSTFGEVVFNEGTLTVIKVTPSEVIVY